MDPRAYGSVGGSYGSVGFYGPFEGVNPGVVGLEDC